ncbi:hypothetical protein ERO13_A10G187501v2 [Gossypium hirsutum]|nr:hypothetical protein ERO13_A10G187501v2 [Gossypium hirsutum]
MNTLQKFNTKNQQKKSEECKIKKEGTNSCLEAFESLLVSS